MIDTADSSRDSEASGPIVRLVDMAVEVTGAERGALLVLADGGLSVRCFRDSRGRDLPRNVIISLSIARKVAEGGPATLEEQGGDRTQGPWYSGSQDLKHRMVMCAPLLEEDRILGVLYVDAQFGAAGFTDATLKLLTAIADQVALALPRG